MFFMVNIALKICFFYHELHQINNRRNTLHKKTVANTRYLFISYTWCNFYGSFTLTKLQTKRLEAEFIHDENPLPASVEDLPIKTGEQEIYEFKGLPFEIEYRQAEMDALRRECGMPPIQYPYRERTERLFKQMKARGYDREHFYDVYGTLVSDTTPSEDNFKKAIKTSEFISLFEQNDIQAIQERIQERLKKNQYDIPALLIQMYLYGSQNKFEQLFANLEKTLIALDYFRSTSVPKEAILYEIYGMATSYGYYSEEAIKDFENESNGGMFLGSAPLLCLLENAGEW